MARIAILGYGDQGRSAYEYWNKPGNTVTICDQNILDKIPNGVKTQFGADYLLDLNKYDLLIRSPALHPSQILQANPEHPEVLNKITTNTNEFFKVCPAPIIGVTGTKGKGTTSTLIAKILENAGYKVHLGGNIGIPPLDLLKNKVDPKDIVVLELANFQLIDLHYSPHIAVCLMVTNEHLDWHKDMYEYIQAKQQLFVHQQHSDLTVYNSDNLYSEEIAGASLAQYKLPYDVPPEGSEPTETRGAYVDGDAIKMMGETVCHVDDVALLGRHNLENICAAIAATWDLVKHKKHTIKKTIKNFAGLPHRLEIVKRVNGVWYINDSFASNVGATIAAIDAIQKQKVMLIGGYERGLDISDLTNKLTKDQTIRKVLLFGQSKDRVAKEFKDAGFNNFVVSSATDISGLIKEAQKYAEKDDAIVLSPGFASFDMFKNFEDRGLQFKEYLKPL